MTISQSHDSPPACAQPFSDHPNIPRRPNDVHIKIVGIRESYPPYTIYTEGHKEQSESRMTAMLKMSSPHRSASAQRPHLTYIHYTRSKWTSKEDRPNEPLSRGVQTPTEPPRIAYGRCNFGVGEIVHVGINGIGGNRCSAKRGGIFFAVCANEAIVCLMGNISGIIRLFYVFLSYVRC